MRRVSEVYPKRVEFMKADDLNGDMLVTISKVEERTLKDKARLVLSFSDLEEYQVVLWENCAHGLAAFVSDDPSEWVGERVLLYVGLPFANAEKPAVLVRQAQLTDRDRLNNETGARSSGPFDDQLGRNDDYPM